MESIQPEGLYIHCHGKRHKIPFVEEKAAIGTTGKIQPSIKAIEMELNDNYLYTLTSYKLEPGERRTIEVKINDCCKHNFPDGAIVQIEQGKLSASFKIIPCINEIQQGRTEIMIECIAFTTTFLPPNTLTGEISGTDNIFNYTQTLHLTNKPDSREEEDMLAKYLQWKEAEEELSCQMEINEADLTSPMSKNSHPNLQEYAAVTTKEPIPDEFNILKNKRTLTDVQLLAKFELDHLDKDVKDKFIKLILKYRPIWVEYPHDEGYHKYVKHRIILTDKLPPSQKQRFWPAHKQEEAEKLINALEKEGIISNWVGDSATNVVLVSKKADPAKKAIEQPLLDQILVTTT